jgi:hypothetical protein
LGLWGANRRLKVRELEDEVAAVEGALDDPNLSHAERIKYRNLKRQLIRDMNEMTGQLPTRSVVSVESAPTLTTHVVGWDVEKWAAGLSGAGGDESVIPERVTPTSASNLPPKLGADPGTPPEAATRDAASSHPPPSPVDSDARGPRTPTSPPPPNSLDPASDPSTPEGRAYLRFLS